MIKRLIFRNLFTLKTSRNLSKAKKSLNNIQKLIFKDPYLIKGPVQLKNFAFEINKTEDELFKVFHDLGIEKSSIVSLINPNIVELILDYFKMPYKTVIETQINQEALRPPIVTIVGHVDHGKTTLLDRLRKSSVAVNEIGGITQKISAFTVNVKNTDFNNKNNIPAKNFQKHKFCIVDTPGHATFSNVRSRGVQVTDLVILVIAADSGIQEQTLECLNLIKAADTPFIICLTKIDKKEKKTTPIYNKLLELNVPLIKFGGNVASFEISAITNEGMQEFVEYLPKEAERLNLLYDRTANPIGNIIDLYVSPHFGTLATCILKQGILKKKDVIECSTSYCRVKQIILEDGSFVDFVEASQPFHLVGWFSDPSPGETFNKIGKEKLKDFKKRPKKDGPTISDKHFGSNISSGKIVTLHDLSYMEYNSENRLKINVLFKCDNYGSAEAVINGVRDCVDERISLNIHFCGIDNLEQNSVINLPPENTLVYTFNSELTPNIKRILEEKKIPYNNFNVIYRLFDHLKAHAFETLSKGHYLEPVGKAKVLATFQLTGKLKRSVIGIYINDGYFYNENNVVIQIYRQNQLIHVDTIDTLKRYKNEVKSVKTHDECGISIKGRFEAMPGDLLICNKLVPDRRSIDWHY